MSSLEELLPKEAAESSWACVDEPNADWDAALSSGFHKLFGALQRAGASMTTPVLLRVAANKYTVCFSAPDKETADRMAGEDGVYAKHMPASKTYSLRFSGWATYERSKAAHENLVAKLTGIKLAPEWAVAQYTSPLWFFWRHNEVIVYTLENS